MNKKIFLLTLILCFLIPLLAQAAMSLGIAVYKTKGDYYNLVDVDLTPDGSMISRFPGVSDLSKPVKLSQGYLLNDVFSDTVFLDVTYEEYSQFENLAPSKLLDRVKYRDPFSEMYYCNRYGFGDDDIDKLNEWIESGQLKDKCDVIINRTGLIKKIQNKISAQVYLMKKFIRNQPSFFLILGFVMAILIFYLTYLVIYKSKR